MGPGMLLVLFDEEAIEVRTAGDMITTNYDRYLKAKIIKSTKEW